MATSVSVPEIRNLETSALVWLDASINNTQDNMDAQYKLRKSINHLKTFDNSDECVEYIQSMSKDRIVLVVSDNFAQEIIPCIHQLRQVSSVYIHCVNNSIDDKWVTQFKKVSGIRCFVY